MAHPFAGQAQTSLKARLKRLGATAGKPHGYSNMYKKKSLPGKNAGRDVGFTIPGGKARGRADRMANGGAVRSKHKPHHTTNIVISAPGGRAGGSPIGAPGAAPPVVQHLHRHVQQPPLVRPPLAPPIGGPVGAPPMGVRPPVLAPGAVPARPALPPGAGAGPLPPMGPPGMKSGGSVKKRKIGGDASPGRGYRGFPHSPTTDVDSAVSARKRGGLTKFANGGDTNGDDDDDQASDRAMPAKKGGKVKAKSVKKRQMGGPMVGAGGGAQPPGLLGMPMPGRAPTPPQQGAPNLSGRPALPAQPLTVPMPPTLTSMRARPAPGTTTGFKKGGKAGHADEAQDRKLIKSMLAKEEKAEKRKRGGAIAPSIEGGHSVLGALRADQRIGSVPKKSVPKGHKSVLHGEKYKNWGKGTSSKIGRKHGGSAGDSIQQAAPTHLAGESYKSWGTGYRKAGGYVGGGSVTGPFGSGSGLGRLRKEKSAAKVPAKTEL